MKELSDASAQGSICEVEDFEMWGFPKLGVPFKAVTGSYRGLCRDWGLGVSQN